jgi:uncharacterized damage-inducible protein DinB
MTRATIAEARVFESWQTFQAALLQAIEPLTEAQLYHQIVPGQRTPGQIVSHIIYGRALWLHKAFGEQVAEVKPFLSWNMPAESPRSAHELAQGLAITWQVLATILTRGTATDEIPAEDVDAFRTIWGLIDHDLPHGGELYLLLGTAGLPGIDL